MGDYRGITLMLFIQNVRNDFGREIEGRGRRNGYKYKQDLRRVWGP